MTSPTSLLEPDTRGRGHFSDCLRDELRREQLAVESAPAIVGLTDPAVTVEHYADVLQRWYRVVSAIQPGVDRSLRSVSPEQSWLESDLRAVGRTPTPRWTDCPDFTEAEALGYRYVMETQHHFSRMLLPSLRRHLGPGISSFSFHEAHRGDTAAWRRTVAALDAVDEWERRNVLIGARSTLLALGKVLSG